VGGGGKKGDRRRGTPGVFVKSAQAAERERDELTVLAKERWSVVKKARRPASWSEINTWNDSMKYMIRKLI
jgi:hypothetical protein